MYSFIDSYHHDGDTSKGGIWNTLQMLFTGCGLSLIAFSPHSLLSCSNPLPHIQSTSSLVCLWIPSTGPSTCRAHHILFHGKIEVRFQKEDATAGKVERRNPRGCTRERLDLLWTEVAEVAQSRDNEAMGPRN